ncbi:alpha/beta hydrolase [Halopseudomonas sp.]|uniref:alpha/beta hydrolase n=1 Tax=Halopseudomonas sp. TaxID=2901191 RepID=UPI0035630942
MNMMKKTAYLGMVISAVALSGCLGGDGGSSANIPPPETPTPQQQRIADGFFEVDEAQLPFGPLAAGVPAYENTSRWHGVIDNAGYRVEVPENWNGMLVMYAHGFRGEGSRLYVDSPPMRQYLLDNGYAWAASSYSTTFYDVRAGVEDTNKLALAFNDIAAENGRTLPAPSKRYITGVSMGGHVTAAAIELEAQQTANNFVPYDGAAPMCGVLGDTDLFDYFAAYNLSLFKFADVPATSFPIDDATAKVATARDVLWNNYDPAVSTTQDESQLTLKGEPLFPTLQNLSGGPRPIYSVSFELFQNLLQSFAGADGTVTGILNDSVIDTTDITYRFESQPGQPLTQAEQTFNNTIVQATPVSGANGLRDDGLRFIPKVNGNLYKAIPVVTVHTIGDLFVPINMEQIYKRRMIDNGFGDQVVQRAVRAPGHCDFTVAEFSNTLDAMIQWEQNGIKPGGDDFLDPATVASSDFGCEYTVNGPVAPGQYPRAFLPPCPVAP